ncbi:MAG: VWA domain-containing protein [Bacteroidia bacterium]|nr:VWA domain-containing protein [Bacteroidia bacterium]
MKKVIFATVFALAGILCSNSFAQEAHHGALGDGGSIYLRADPVNKFFLENTDNQDLALYFHLQGLKKELGNSKRAPYNLSIVIDKSGSMQGDKIENVKKAVNYVINQLTAEDYLSVVTYDNGVQILFESQKVESKDKLTGKISSIVADGGTNLEGGMKKGFELARENKVSHKANDFINRVFLLSDGQANVGETNSDVLANWCKSYFSENSISLSSFGVGTDYNEDLMSKLASNAGGMYYFISDPEKITTIFQQEMNGASLVVGKNVVLEIDIPEDKADLVKVYQLGYEKKNGKVIVHFNDIFSEEQKSVVVRFKLFQKTSAPIHFKCRLVYRNANNEPATDVKDERKIILDPVPNKDQLAIGLSKQSSEGYTLQVCSEMYEDAVKLADVGKYEESAKMVKDAMDLMDLHFKKFGEHPFLKEVYTDLSEYAATIKDMKNMSNEDRKYSVKNHKFSSFKKRTRAKF